VNNDIVIKPYSSRYKIYIIPEADLMTVQAQNALLKTIEEPPAYAVILLLVNNGGSLLPTISSRCVTLNFKPVRDEVIKKYLMEELHVPDYQAEVSVAFAQGNVGKAKQIAMAEDFTEMMESALRILKKGNDMEVYEMVDAIRVLSEDKHTIYEYLDLFLVWFRDVLMFKATHEIDGLVFRQEYRDIKNRADKSSYEGLETIIKAIETAKKRLQANVNFELTMELLFLTIREN
jgi:DNA polymerase-3 subunit delta'